MTFFTLKKIEKLYIEIKSALVHESINISSFKFFEGNCESAQAMDFDDSIWEDFSVGDFWGGYDVWVWFRTRIEIPETWKQERLYLNFQVGPRDEGGSTAEALLYVNGSPLQGIDVWHPDVWLPPEITETGKISLALHAWSGVLDVPARRRFKHAQLQRIDPDAEQLAYITDTLVRTIKGLDENDLRRQQILSALNQAYLQIDFGKPKSEQFYRSISTALTFIQEKMDQWALIEEMKPTIVGIGHAHIDMAWLWRLSHTREKASRTFATALHLMRQYPEYCYLHSSPQLYKFLEQDYPHIFDRIRQQIKLGQWEITGATWVEPDTNMPNGESLVRQFLFGRRYVRDTFGIEMKLLWLPDVFGYSAALPQIIHKSGIKYFMTTKISWSQFNRFPNDTFKWRGLDGTEVLTHFITTPETDSLFYTYNGQLSPEEVKGIWDAYRQKDLNDELLLSFGWGDGGGGPTREMLEWSRHQRNLPGQPRVRLGKAEDYFKRLDERVSAKDLPVWDGELYLEYHRGTYTSQAQIKRDNRLAEILYHNAEWLSATADILGENDLYPVELLNEGWEKILLNQFHDILPGSSIHPVYEDSALDFAEVRKIGQGIIEQAIDSLCSALSGNEDQVVVFNSLSWERSDLIQIPIDQKSLLGKTLLLPDGQPADTQKAEVDGETILLCESMDIPALGYRVFPLINCKTEKKNSLTIKQESISSPYYEIKLNQSGQIVSLYDRVQNRQVIPEGGRANVLQVFEDKPMAFDAWDIDIYYQEKMREITDLVDAVVEETGPLRGSLRLTWKFADSTIRQRVRVYANNPRIDFDTQVDWHEAQVLMKAAFPVEIRATRASYEIQYGHVERPTHWNTSWDWARFEVSAHTWADLSEGDYGVALLNDCKYGYDIKDNVVRLTLIKSSVRPDALADKGHHRFTYSLLPHNAGWRAGQVKQQAHHLNNPLITKVLPAEGKAGQLPVEFSFASLNVDHVIMDTVKKAENGDGWVIRVYEYQQNRCKNIEMMFGKPLRKVVECDLMEEHEQAVVFEGQQLNFDIKPFEIKTFKVWF